MGVAYCAAPMGGSGLRSAFLGVCVLLVALASARGADAQVLPSVDTRTYRPSTDPNASMILEPVATPGPGLFAFGAIGSWSFRPLVLKKAGTEDVAYRPLEHVFALDATGQVGIGQRFALGASVPMILYQDGDGRLPKTVSEVDHAPRTALGDAALTLKGAIVRNEEGGFGLSAIGYVSLPTGDRASFAGDGSTTVTTRLLAEYNVAIAFVQASVGYKVRTDHHTWPAQELGGVRFGDELPWTLGLAIRPGLFGIDPGNRQRLEVAGHGWLPMGPVGPFGTGDPGSAALSPAMIAISDRIEIGHYRDTYLLVGADIGLNSAVGVPAIRGVIGFGWSPREHDMDHDGVKDDVDGCPEIPEDRDGFEDNDGCPEIDNDDDGIIDKEDRCPNVKGVASSDPSKNGCPAEGPTPSGVDTDADGIPDDKDKCPTQAEDKDGFQDNDGCPDPDNDNDGVSDKDDACPNEAGEPSSDPKRNGCPNVDRDGDTFENAVDKCPDVAETFNGVDDDDGCPDEGGKPLVTIDDKRAVRVAAPLKMTGPLEAHDVDPSSMPTMRALALELNRHRDWTLAVGFKPGAGENAELDALNRSFAVVRVLSTLTRRDAAAETVSWDVVKNQPGAASGQAFVVLIHGPAKPEAPKAAEPAKPEAPKTPPAKPEAPKP